MKDNEFLHQIRHFPWAPILAVLVLGCFGLALLYSAANGDLHPWAMTQGGRFIILFGLMILLGLSNVNLWLRLAYPLYFLMLVALVSVDLFGQVGMGAQRWIDLGFMRFQPSEFMKIALVLALARYYHFLPPSFISKFRSLIIPIIMIAIPFFLVLSQPDLGTGLMLIFTGVAMLFLAGVRWGWFAGAFALAAAAAPIIYGSMRPYQRKRIMTFLSPENDALGSGYHISQSKIAIGSGGPFGKGFLNGTQAALEYLPERHTDFIFATMAEEWGLLGGLLIVCTYGYIFYWSLRTALASRMHFACMAGVGLSFTLFLYVLINIAMVMGLMPVVGVPLPLISYGGSAMMTMMVIMGILIALARHNQEDTTGQNWGARAQNDSMKLHQKKHRHKSG